MKGGRQHTFSCLRCLSSFNSRYVLLLSTGVEKGFIIFLMATDVLDNWSFAELSEADQHVSTLKWRTSVPDESEGAHTDRLEVNISRGDLEYLRREG